MASALLEDNISRVVAYLAGSDEAWILFTGRPVSTLLQQADAIIVERTLWRPTASAEAVRGLLREAGELLEYRNAVIHALWLSEPSNDSPDRLLPWHTVEEGEQVFYAARARVNRSASEMWVTAAGVQELAERLRASSSTLIEGVSGAADALQSGFVELPSDPGWVLR